MHGPVGPALGVLAGPVQRVDDPDPADVGRRATRAWSSSSERTRSFGNRSASRPTEQPVGAPVTLGPQLLALEARRSCSSARTSPAWRASSARPHGRSCCIRSKPPRRSGHCSPMARSAGQSARSGTQSARRGHPGDDDPDPSPATAVATIAPSCPTARHGRRRTPGVPRRRLPRRPALHGRGVTDGTGVRLRLSVDESNVRPGGTVSGPVADGPGRLCGLAGHRRPDRPGGAVGDHQPPHRLPAQAGPGRRGRRRHLLKLGSRLGVVEVALHSVADDALVAKAQVTYSIPPR